MSTELFDSTFLAKLNNLKLAMNMRLDRGMSGSRKSSAKGSSVEFSDFREYIPGDDIRRIDWNVYGRLDKLVIKQFMEEKEAYYHIILDTSASMDFGEKKKSHLALRLAAVFVWLVQKQLDRVEILTLSGGRLGKTNPINGRNSFGRLLKELEEVEFSGTTGLSEGIRRLPLNGRGICIIISDFLDPSGMDEAIKYLTYKKQDILMVQTLAREEVAFEGEGTLGITDLETGEEVRVSVNRNTIKGYQDALNKHNTDLERLAKKYGARFISVVSDEDIEKIVFETLHQKGIFG